MTPRDAAGVWLLLALFLPQITGCFPLSGPRSVRGTEGGSVKVTCRYEEEFKASNKYWCRKPVILPPCNKIVETKGSDGEVRRGRVTIRDRPARLTFTVTLENLTREDTDTYWCGIDTPWYEGLGHTFSVTVSVAPVLSPKSMTSTWRPSTALTTPTLIWEDTPSPGPQPRPLSLYFLLLVFLKLPLFLSMLGAVLWVNRPQRHCGHQSQPDGGN